MVQKEFTFRGKTLQEVKQMSLADFMKLIPAKERRHLKRGMSDGEKKVLQKVRAGKQVETHMRDMVIIPEMVGKTIKVRSGKEYQMVFITEEMLGHRLGEFALTRKSVKHGAAGIGATKSTAHQSVK